MSLSSPPVVHITVALAATINAALPVALQAVVCTAAMATAVLAVA